MTATPISPRPGCLALVLAAGEGTRMKSARPKVLHEVAGRSMLAHVLAGVMGAGAERVAVVVGPDRDDVSAEAKRAVPAAQVFVQSQRLGTAAKRGAGRPPATLTTCTYWRAAPRAAGHAGLAAGGGRVAS